MEVLRSWFLVLGSSFSVLGSRFAVLGSRFSVRGSRFSVLGSRFSVLGLGVPTGRSIAAQGSALGLPSKDIRALKGRPNSTTTAHRMKGGVY